MKIFGIILFVLIAIISGGVFYLSQFGLFASVEIAEKDAGPYLLVYKKHIGDYKNVGKVMDEIYHDLKDNFALETTKGFGLYYDNPQEVEKEKLRSIAGCIIEKDIADKAPEIAKKYILKEYPKTKSVVAEFPYNGKLSIFLGLFKVYPKLIGYIAEKKHAQTPIMEIYDVPGKKIEYISSYNIDDETFQSFLN